MAQVSHAVIDWRAMALSDEVGLNEKELEDFAPAFEHWGIAEVGGLLRKS